MTRNLDRTRMIATAWFLAGLGAVPFVGMALAGVFWPELAATQLGGENAFLGYGAVILSFMGGIRWGRALSLEEPALAAGQMILSVAPSLAAWLALLIDRPWSLVLLMACFALQAIWDLRSAGNGLLPHWFARLRLAISVIVIASIALVLLA